MPLEFIGRTLARLSEVNETFPLTTSSDLPMPLVSLPPRFLMGRRHDGEGTPGL